MTDCRDQRAEQHAIDRTSREETVETMTTAQRAQKHTRRRISAITIATLSAALAVSCTGTEPGAETGAETTYPPVSAFPDEAATGWDDGWAISATSDGGAVIAGGFTGNADFGATRLQSRGGIDIYVAKLDADGNWLWATSGGGPADDEAYGVTVTGDGSIAVTGYIQDSANFHTTTLTSSGGSDVYVAKLDADGNWLWATSGGGPGYDRARNITSDNDGNLYVTGWYWEQVQLGPTALTSSGYGDTYVAKLDADGNWLWATSGGGNGNDQGHGITTVDGGVAISGYFRDQANFGRHQVTATGDYDAYVAKLDADGNWLWATSGGGSGYDRGLGLTHRQGRLLLAGFFYGDAAFGDIRLLSAGDGDIYVAELDTNGKWESAVRAGSFDYDEAYAAHYSADGNIVVYGSIGGATAEFGALTITSAGSDDIFAAQLDAGGNWRWVIRAGGPNRDEGYAMTQTANGDILAAGTYRDQVLFDKTSLTAGPGSEIFAARITADGSWGWVSSAGGRGN